MATGQDHTVKVYLKPSGCYKAPILVWVLFKHPGLDEV